MPSIIKFNSSQSFCWRLETYHVSELQPGEVVWRDKLGPALFAQVDVEVDGGVEDSHEVGHLAGRLDPTGPMQILRSIMVEIFSEKQNG